jgi:hypothetical protein
VDGINGPIDDLLGSLSPDELTIYFYRSDANALTSSIYTASRAHLNDAFGSPTLVPTVNGGMYNSNPAVTSDGLTMFFTSTGFGAPSPPAPAIFITHRQSVSASFDAPTMLAALTDSSAGFQDLFLTSDASLLYFVRIAMNATTVYRASCSGTTCGGPQAVSDVNTTTSQIGPVVTGDQLTIFFGSATPQGTYDIFTATRATRNDPFGPRSPVAELNGPRTEFPGWVSADGCTIYMHRRSEAAAHDHDIYVARRPP